MSQVIDITLGGDAMAVAPGSSCMCVKGNGAVCGKKAVDGLCAYHARIEARRAEKELVRERQKAHAQMLRSVLRRYGHDNPDSSPAAVDEYLRSVEDQGHINRSYRIKLFRVYMDALARARNARQPKPELQQFVEDSQNVHRKVVTDNTNDQTEKLLAVTVPSEQNTLAEIQKLFRKSRKVIADVEHWYALTMCRKEADCLYKRTLDGLWAMIKTSEHKEELCKRLVEELTESVGMCCEGHLSRLCNVLVGFDDAFTTVVSKGEILQKKMAEIAALDVTVRTKKMRAKKILQELAIPVSQHADWLDAF